MFHLGIYHKIAEKHSSSGSRSEVCQLAHGAFKREESQPTHLRESIVDLWVTRSQRMGPRQKLMCPKDCLAGQLLLAA
jgi:hypothetical protein